MFVFLSLILRTLENYGMLLPPQSLKSANYAHMFVLLLPFYKYIYSCAASTFFVIWVFYIFTVGSKIPRSLRYENNLRHVSVSLPLKMNRR